MVAKRTSGERAPRRNSSPETREIPLAHDIVMPGYSITISPGILESAGMFVHSVARAHRYAIVTDIGVAARYGAPLLASFAPQVARLFTFAGGEAYKTRDSWARITDEMAEAGYGRDSAVVSLGGGVASDLAGFVAATYMRGVPVAHVPTTLLGMVDASVGGKTGVDIPAGKNLVGAFHQPCAVIVDPLVLASLPRDDLRSGFAEVLKHGVIADASFFDRMARAIPRLLDTGGESGQPMLDAVRRGISIKCDIVRRDERESGVRNVLNFGHTIGHAIELVSHYGIKHGAAVAMGMVAEAHLAERLGIAQAGTRDRIANALAAAGLPTAIPEHLAAGALISATRSDKKARAGEVRYALPTKIGAMAGEESGWTIPVDDAAVHEVLARR